jgi:hypothetical protein
MKIDDLAYRNAEKHVQSYSDECRDLLKLHAEAKDCRNCEAFLQIGIDAFDWLMRADRQFRMAIYRGEKDFNPKIEQALRAQYKKWLDPCELAEKWIEIQQTRGFEIDNLKEFRDCVRQMIAIVEANEEGDNASLPKQIAAFRDSAIEEHRNGQTAEFI